MIRGAKRQKLVAHSLLTLLVLFLNSVGSFTSLINIVGSNNRFVRNHNDFKPHSNQRLQLFSPNQANAEDDEDSPRGLDYEQRDERERIRSILLNGDDDVLENVLKATSEITNVDLNKTKLFKEALAFQEEEKQLELIKGTRKAFI